MIAHILLKNDCYDHFTHILCDYTERIGDIADEMVKLSTANDNLNELCGFSYRIDEGHELIEEIIGGVTEIHHVWGDYPEAGDVQEVDDYSYDIYYHESDGWWQGHNVDYSHEY